ncbi:adenylate/guanylate cyclase domain-containing protein, partial [bacterium]|nr:adenylate/guanylate cyclase domain-containing protein [bacterium]
EYFSAMTKIIFEHQGTLDKFIGDCIMAVFGAPLAIPDHTKKALHTAIKMREELGKLQKKWKKEGKTPFRVGIGINSGEVVVGNIGSEERMEYTAVGSEVNLASRLESLTREYEAEIIISEAVYKKVKDIIEARALGETKIKGMKRPVRIYEVLCLK